MEDTGKEQNIPLAYQEPIGEIKDGCPSVVAVAIAPGTSLGEYVSP